MKKIIIYPLIIVFLINIVCAEDLSDFPDMFVEGNDLDALIAVGDGAPSSDAIAQANLAVFFTNYLGKPVSGKAKLASEISDLEQNLILIGSPCNNEISSEILGANPCDEELEEGKAIIRLIEDDEIFYLVVMSDSNKGVREAADVLTNYEDYDLSGDEFILEIEDYEESEEADVETEKARAEEEKQRMIEELSKKITKQEEEPEDEEEEFEEEALEEVIPEPEEEGFFKRIATWFKSLFGG